MKPSTAARKRLSSIAPTPAVLGSEEISETTRRPPPIADALSEISIVEPETRLYAVPNGASSPADDVWTPLRILANRFRRVEKARVGLQLQLASYKRSGIGHLAGFRSVILPAIKNMKQFEALCEKDLYAQGLATELREYQKYTRGLGKSLFLAVASMPHPPGEYRSFPGYWKSAGAHPPYMREAYSRTHGGKLDYAPYRFGLWFRLVKGLMATGKPKVHSKGKLKGITLNCSPSDYRACYDRRKAHTLKTHPSPDPNCPMCL